MALTAAPCTSTPGDLEAAVRRLPVDQRPRVVRVVTAIPLTTWYRPLETDHLPA